MEHGSSDPCSFFIVVKLLAYGCDQPARNLASFTGCLATGGLFALLAVGQIDNDAPLVIANGDQFIDMDLTGFVEDAVARDLDGSMITFPSVHPKWSFARTGDDGLVVETAEKRGLDDSFEIVGVVV